MVELPVESFVVRRFLRTIMRDDHVSHMGGVAPPAWQSMPCKRAAGGRNLACLGLSFVPLYCTSWILGVEDQELNIVAVSQGIPPLLNGQAPPLRGGA